MTFLFSLYSPLGYEEPPVWEWPLPRDLSVALAPGCSTDVFQIPAFWQIGLENPSRSVPAENKSSADERN